MYPLVAVGLATLVSLAAPAGGATGGVSGWVREYANAYASRVSSVARHRDAAAPIPAWTRKYNLDCSACHWPAAPRLNAMGIRFRWAGYRMPDEIGQKVDVKDLGHYVAMRGRMQYVYDKTQGQPATSDFNWNDATLFFSGPFGKHYSGFFELEREAEDALELVAQIGGLWGNQESYGGVRTGLMHWLLRDGVAGFDRPTGIRTPLPLANPLTSTIPFRFSKDQLGAEGFFVTGRNRVSVEVLNGINSAGAGDEKDPDTNRDFVLTDQLLFDNKGSGITAVGYYGQLVGLAPSDPGLNSKFWRLGGSANWIVNKLELMGGVVYGKDTDLPRSVSLADRTALGYWAYGGYSIPVRQFLWTLYGRYEFLDPNTDVAGDGSKRFVFGTVLPVNLPEYLRLAVEYAHDLKQAAAAPKRNGLTAEVMLNF
jgi:hypothetical protein